MGDTSRGITSLLSAVSAGETGALDRLYSAVYDELHRMARHNLARERADHTWQPTALVHEAYLRLAGGGGTWRTRAHFFGAAAEAMRRLLIDHARRRGRVRRGEGKRPLDLSAAEFAAAENSPELLALDEALRRLEERDPRMADIVKLRFFAGLSVEDTALALEISPRTVKREWALARAWLFSALRDSETEEA